MLSVFDMFKIGIGPSSSHTVGPMVAAKRFADALLAHPDRARIAHVTVDLYGSLALTGKGHGTVEAILNGLEGKVPKTVDPSTVVPRAQALMQDGATLLLGGEQPVPFHGRRDVVLHMHEFLPKHANGMRCRARDGEGRVITDETYYSVGGGFIVSDAEFGLAAGERAVPPYPFANAQELMAHCEREGKTIAQIVMTNELTWQDEAAVRAGLLEIAAVMKSCVESGCRHEGDLPGGYGVKRRAPAIFRRIVSLQLAGRTDVMLWPMLYAIAVSEENAAGGRIVTAPTNGAAGIIPSVLQYYRNFHPQANDQGIVDFLLTAAAVGMLYKMNASISGAEVGCQGEVGVACSMAAAGYCAVSGGNLAQVENAAEIAMEHHLGLTCDPVGGLVQIPCVERNGVAAEKAIKCAQLAIIEDGRHKISLDQVIDTMYRTGMDMQNKYKETSLGGLALTVGIPAC
ncbi:L-serine ammonia-lyase [Jeongeupia chitinilytica]|uniref:L-serine dehydratase n=1 Tax=Jeongeupia chitinilytica TaxID=1041641 RepID=A0ABQ3GYR5_9NEIS|nr:L-serine ammonia-lyase [Jeongeupia chitinilytica]GHD60920.1 L-serine dehydratase [Jeongeupia chitinilytica]